MNERKKRVRDQHAADRWENTWPALLMLLIILTLWEAAVRIFHVSELVIPAPSVIFYNCFKYFDVSIKEGWLTTVGIFMLSYFTGVPVGIIIASLLSQSKLLTKAFSPLIILLVTLPMMVVVPVYMVWVGYEVKYRALLAFIQVAAILTLNTMSGFQNVAQSKLNLAAGYGANRWQTFFKVIFPNALPEVFQGLRIGCTVTLMNVIGIEFIAGKVGLGFSITYYCQLLKMPIVWSCVLLVGLTGRLLFMIVELLQKRIITWRR